MIFQPILIRPLFGPGAHVDTDFKGFVLNQEVIVQGRTEYVGGTEHWVGIPMHMAGGRGRITKLFVDARGIPSVQYVGLTGYAYAPISALRA